MIEKPKRVVLDTNVVISAILFRTTSPRLAITRAFQTGLVLSSMATRNELREVMRRTKFDRYIRPDIRQQAIEDFIGDTEAIEAIDRIQMCKDPKDDKFLELAVTGRADVIVSGDLHLLELHPFRGIAILTPIAYLNTFTGLH